MAKNSYSILYQWVIGLILGGGMPFSVFSQELLYVSITDGEKTLQEISKSHRGAYEVIEIQEPEQYSKHFFLHEGSTQEWVHQNHKENTEFTAERTNNVIQINGVLRDEKIQKSVSIDKDIWINKIDQGLSYFALSGQESITFWTLKLSDLEPLQFKAEKVGIENLKIDNQVIEAVKLKMTLKNMFLSKLWSAYLWYRTSDGLFLKYEGAKGGPGTPTTTIEIVEGM